MSKKHPYFDRNGLLIRSLPTKKNLLREALTEASTDIRKQLLKAAPSDGIMPFDGKYEKLKRAVYQIGRHCLMTGRTKLLAKLAMKQTSPGENGSGARLLKENLPDPATNPFFYVYHLIVSNTPLTIKDSKTAFSIDRKQRYKGTSEMRYAHQHNVPVEFLRGFIQQSGGHTAVMDKLNGGKHEPWYDWKTKCLQDDPSTND